MPSSLSDLKPKLLYYYDRDEKQDAFVDLVLGDYEFDLVKNDAAGAASVLGSAPQIDALVVDLDSFEDLADLRLVEKVAEANPKCLNVVLHDNFTLDALAELVNSQPVSKCFAKPFDPTLLRSNVYAAKWGGRGIKPSQDLPEPDVDQMPLVLIVDDEQDAVKYLVKQLEHDSNSFKVMAAYDAEQALEIVAEHKNSLAVVITDQRMPGKQGVDLLLDLLNAHPLTVRVLTSAYKDLDVALGAINDGRIFSYLKKPWDADEILNLIEMSLDRYQSRLEKEQNLKSKRQDLSSIFVAERKKKLAERLKNRLSNEQLFLAVDAYLSALEKLPLIGTVSENFEDELEQASSDLIVKLCAVLESKLDQVNELRDNLDSKLFKDILWARMGLDSQIKNSTDECKNHDKAVTLFLSSWSLLLESSGHNLEDLDFREKAADWAVHCTDSVQLCLLQHALSPLKRVSDALVEQQVALLLLFMISLHLGLELKLLQNGGYLGLEIFTTEGSDHSSIDSPEGDEQDV